MEPVATLTEALVIALSAVHPFVTILTTERPSGHQCYLHEVDGRLLASVHPDPARLRKTQREIDLLSRMHETSPWWGSFIERNEIRRVEIKGADGWSLLWNADGWDRGHHTRLTGDVHSAHA